MKRKCTTTPSSSSLSRSGKSYNKKRNITQSPLFQTETLQPDFNNGSTINDFFQVTSLHKSRINEMSRPNIIVKQIVQKKKPNTLSKYLKGESVKEKHQLILPAQDIMIKVDIDKVNFFNEEHVKALAAIVNKDIIEDLKSSYKEMLTLRKDNQMQFQFLTYDEKLINNFITISVNNFITKCLLMLYDNLYYIPKSYILGQASEEDKRNIKLISGFDERKKIEFMYYPINNEEAKFYYPDLVSTITNYIKKFKKTPKKKKTVQTQTALVLYQKEDYMQNIKKIEMICDDLGYQIIRLDEEANKAMKLNKASEATKSKRISSLPEDLKNKINIIEYLTLQKENYKWKKYLEENDIHVPEKNNEMVIDLENNDTQISTQQNTISNLLNINLISRANHANAQNIDKTTNEYKVFENFQSNLFDISFNKKTLILITDTFTPVDDDNRNYLSSIISKIPSTKCPIIILTNNLSIFTSISPPSNIYHFSFYKIEDEGKNHKLIITFTIALILYFHLYVHHSKSNDINEIIKIIKENTTMIRMKMMNFNGNDRLIKAAVHIAIEKDYNLEKIMIYLSSIIKQKDIKEDNWDDKIEILENSIKGNEELDEDSQLDYGSIYDINNELGSVNESLELMSSFDMISGKAESKTNYYHYNLLKKKINSSLPINLEDYFIKNELIPLDVKTNSDVYLIDLIKSKKFPLYKKTITHRTKENKDFYYIYLNDHYFLSNNSMQIYNSLLLSIMNTISYEELAILANKRRTRRSQSNNKLNIVSYLFPKSTTEQVERFLSSLSFSDIYYEYPKNHYTDISNKIKHYFDDFHFFDLVISNQKNNYTLMSQSMQDNEKDEEEDELISNEEDDIYE